MIITVQDASNYFKGLLLLSRKDRKITQSEIDLLKHIGKLLGFEPRFCDNAIAEILENEHIVDEVPCFSSRQLAIKFIKDGFVVALADGEAHPSELEWLRATAQRNNLDMESFSHEWEKARSRKQVPDRLEADGLMVKYS